MPERMNYPQQEVLPGVEWPESPQPELPFDCDLLLGQWSDEELRSFMDDLEVDSYSTSSSVARLAIEKVSDEIWDYSINRKINQE